MSELERDERMRIYQMIDGLGQSIQRVDARTRSVERIVSNGLQDRTIRIEKKLDAQDEKIDALISEVHGLHRRVDGCVDRDDYEADRREEWDGKERRMQQQATTRSDRWFRVAMIALQLLMAAVVTHTAARVFGG